MNSLIVGLGNPGPQYSQSRHNIGFMVTDRLASLERIDLGKSKFNSHYGTGNCAGESVALLQPQTFMNLSGRAVFPAAQFFQIPPEKVIVIHDDLDLPFRTLKIKFGGGHGGHNGLRSIISEGLGADFIRVRVGIGRPPAGDPADYVLGHFTQEEREWLPGLIDEAAEAVEKILSLGLQKAMNQVNTRREEA